MREGGGGGRRDSGGEREEEEGLQRRDETGKVVGDVKENHTKNSEGVHRHRECLLLYNNAFLLKDTGHNCISMIITCTCTCRCLHAQLQLHEHAHEKQLRNILKNCEKPAATWDSTGGL